MLSAILCFLGFQSFTISQKNDTLSFLQDKHSPEYRAKRVIFLHKKMFNGSSTIDSSSELGQEIILTRNNIAPNYPSLNGKSEEQIQDALTGWSTNFSSEREDYILYLETTIRNR